MFEELNNDNWINWLKQQVAKPYLTTEQRQQYQYELNRLQPPAIANDNESSAGVAHDLLYNSPPPAPAPSYESSLPVNDLENILNKSKSSSERSLGEQVNKLVIDELRARGYIEGNPIDV